MMTKRRKVSTNNLFESIKEQKWSDIALYLNEASIPDSKNNYPFHEICTDSEAPIKVVVDIYNAYPKAALLRASNNYTPIALAVDCGFETAVQFLANVCPQSCMMHGVSSSLNRGKMSYHRLSSKAKMPFKTFDITRNFPGLNLRNIRSSYYLPLFLSCLSSAVGYGTVSDELPNHRIEVFNLGNVFARPTDKDLEATNIILIYLLAFIGKGTTGSLENYNQNSAIGMKRILLLLEVIDEDFDENLLQVSKAGIDKIKDGVQDDHGVLKLVGKFICSCISLGSGPEYQFFMEHRDHIKNYKQKYIECWEIVTKNYASPASLFSDIFLANKQFDSHVRHLIIKCGENYEFAAFLCPELVAKFVKNKHIKRAYIKYAIAASYIDPTLDDMFISGRRISEFKALEENQKLCNACRYGTSFLLPANDATVRSNIFLRSMYDNMTSDGRGTIRRFGEDGTHIDNLGVTTAGTLGGNFPVVPNVINTNNPGAVPPRVTDSIHSHTQL